MHCLINWHSMVINDMFTRDSSFCILFITHSLVIPWSNPLRFEFPQQTPDKNQSTNWSPGSMTNLRCKFPTHSSHEHEPRTLSTLTSQPPIHILYATLIRLPVSVDTTRSSKHDNDAKFVIKVNYIFPLLCIIIDS